MRKKDIKLILIVLVLTFIGFFFIYDTTATRLMAKELSPYIFVQRQFIAFLIAIAFFLFFVTTPYRVWERLWRFIYGFNLLLLILVLFFGRESLGAQRWFSIFGFSFQPSELSKLLIVISLAGFLSELDYKRKKLGFKEFVFSIILILIPFLAVMVQPDLGTAIVIFVTGIFILFLSEISYKYLLRLILLGFLLLPFLWLILKPYQQQRILTFLDPMKDPLGSGYQVIQSIIAIGSGGIWGKGWFQGTQTHLNLIPEQHTDFIFSAVGEEFGFLGGAFIVLLYYLLFKYTWEIARSIKDKFGKYVIEGILFCWFFQTFVNLCMVMGIFPVVGIPLPFISFARTSLIVNYAMLGLIINIYTRGERQVI
ncbi:MAG: rod shape-determining protein RodA [Dictyoglomus thermophilum]|nr:rod shape-determining protein RodA [Dictyoglomus thermophilum]MCX7719781.1 rod shape-determining protein RodA [Dictyoglomus thermophilum]